MPEMVLTKSGLRAGVWEAILSASPTRPEVEIVHEQSVLPGLEATTLAGTAGAWTLKFPIPAKLLSEGVQTFALRRKGSGDVLGHFTIIAGAAMEDDVRAELDLLRAELDMLKRAFRRHCLETAT
jgi:hypothetical protein